VPRYHPRPQPEVTTLTGMLTAGGADLVSGLRGINYRGATILNALRATYPNARDASIQALLNYERARAHSGVRDASADPSKPIRATTGFRNPNIAAGVRYTVRVPVIGAYGGKQYEEVTIDWGRALSRNALEAMVSRALAGQVVAGLHGSPRRLASAITTGPIVVIGVERGAG